VLLIELFPTTIRSTGTAISLSVIGIFGGFTPLALTWLSHQTDWGIVMILMLIGLISLYNLNSPSFLFKPVLERDK
jgi:predicted RND superfamily exporter protein